MALNSKNIIVEIRAGAGGEPVGRGGDEQLRFARRRHDGGNVMPGRGPDVHDAGREEMQARLQRVERGEVDILLGTQMIAKGLDFPNVTLVGVINADVGINLPDFRASERTFQLLTQVAGRAGRGVKGGEVIVQTSLPTHYVVECALQHDFVGFAEKELAARQHPLYPPLCRLVNVVVSGLVEEGTQKAAESAAAWLDGLLKAKLRGSGLEPYVEVIAHIDTEAEKRLVPVYRLEP